MGFGRFGVESFGVSGLGFRLSTVWSCGFRGFGSVTAQGEYREPRNCALLPPDPNIFTPEPSGALGYRAFGGLGACGGQGLGIYGLGLQGAFRALRALGFQPSTRHWKPQTVSRALTPLNPKNPLY